MRKVWFTAAAILVVPLGSFSADEMPSKMAHVITQMSGTDIPDGAFAGKPKTMWSFASATRGFIWPF
jgi:hypothetical protein